MPRADDGLKALDLVAPEGDGGREVKRGWAIGHAAADSPLPEYPPRGLSRACHAELLVAEANPSKQLGRTGARLLANLEIGPMLPISKHSGVKRCQVGTLKEKEAGLGQKA
jgi:hypothetical protein